MSFGLLDPRNSFQIYKGASKTLQLTVVQDDPDNLGSCIPVDITGWTVYFTVKEKPDSTEVLIRKTSTVPTEITINDPRGGEAQIFIVPADTAGFDTSKSYAFDVWLESPSGDRYPVVTVSTLRVLQGVTSI
jgi:hypothetical protein